MTAPVCLTAYQAARPPIWSGRREARRSISARPGPWSRAWNGSCISWRFEHALDGGVAGRDLGMRVPGTVGGVREDGHDWGRGVRQRHRRGPPQRRRHGHPDPPVLPVLRALRVRAPVLQPVCVCQIEAVQNGVSIQSETAAGSGPIERKACRHCLFFYPIRAWVRLYDSPSNLIILPWCTVLSTIAVAMFGSSNTRPQSPDSMFVV